MVVGEEGTKILGRNSGIKILTVGTTFVAVSFDYETRHADML